MFKNIFSFLAVIILLASCNQFDKAPSGMLYKISHGAGNPQKIAQGQYVKLHLEYKLKGKDSVLNSTFANIPVYFPVDTARLGKYNFFEIILKCKKGDKVDFTLSVDSLVKMGALQYNEMFKAKDAVIGRAEILDVFTKVQDVDADYKNETEKEKKKEIAVIKDYLAKNKINAVQSPEGVFVVVKEAGAAASKIDTGSIASVIYKGYTFKGDVFDSNMKGDSTKPFDVKVGTGSVIPGWEIGLKYFGKGGKGSLYIPAMLGYGPQANGPIKAYENLAFDIEIEDVTKGK